MKLEAGNLTVWVCFIVWTQIVEVGSWAGGFGDRCPDSKIDEIDDLGRIPKTCFDIIDSYGDCLLDDMILPESMCRSVFGSKTYEKMLKEQEAIDKKYDMMKKKNYYSKKKYYKKFRDRKYRGKKHKYKKYGKKGKNKDLKKKKYNKKENTKKKYKNYNKNK